MDEWRFSQFCDRVASRVAGLNIEGVPSGFELGIDPVLRIANRRMRSSLDDLSASVGSVRSDRDR
jgi:hypothetical protein